MLKMTMNQQKVFYILHLFHAMVHKGA